VTQIQHVNINVTSRRSLAVDASRVHDVTLWRHCDVITAAWWSICLPFTGLGWADPSSTYVSLLLVPPRLSTTRRPT